MLRMPDSIWLAAPLKRSTLIRCRLRMGESPCAKQDQL